MAEGLHAFSAKVVGLIALSALVSLASCTKGKPATIPPSPSTSAPPAAPSVNESTVQGKPMQVIEVEDVKDAPIVDINSYPGFVGLTEHGDFTVGNGYMIVYDEVRNAFVLGGRLKQQEERIHGARGIYYLANGTLYRYGDMVAPNTSLAIYPLSGAYFSVYMNRRAHNYSVISSTDLINWHLTTIATDVPILLFRKDNDLFAIADDKVFRVQDQSLVQQIPGPKEDANEHWWYYLNAKDAVIFSYCMDDIVAVYHQRDFEDSQGEYFLTVNLNDLSYKRSKADKGIEAVGYVNRVVKRVDGWKVYFVATDPHNGVRVLDPLASGGPAFVERLPGVLVK